MTAIEFKSQIHTMTPEQKKVWVEIHNRLVCEVNDKDFKTKLGYKNAMRKVYNKTISEYLKTQNKKDNDN